VEPFSAATDLPPVNNRSQGPAPFDPSSDVIVPGEIPPASARLCPPRNINLNRPEAPCAPLMLQHHLPNPARWPGSWRAGNLEPNAPPDRI
jgi:hypothetical protein